MNCAQHTEIEATAFCRECGKPMCAECQRPAMGSIYCDTHVPATAPATPPPPSPFAPSPTASFVASAQTPTPYAASPYTAPVPPPATDESVHPVLAALLGFIPGVGAIYNGQYAKGLVHAVIFALLVSAISSDHQAGIEAFLGIMIAAWVFYMVFEAYHTARKRRYGVAVEEFSGHFDFRAGNSKFPMGAILLIGLGFILLLDTTDIISIDEFGKYWPVGLILLGVYLLYSRLNPGNNLPGAGTDSRGKDAGGKAMNDQSQLLLRSIKGPVIMITIGVLFAADRFTDYHFHQTWPVLLIVIGLMQLLAGRRRRADYYPPPVSQMYSPAPPPPPAVPTSAPPEQNREQQS